MKIVKSFFQALYRLSCNFILMLSLIFTGLLFVAGFLFTCYADNMTTQQVLTRADNPLLHLLGVFILGGAILSCCKLASKQPTLGKKILLCMTMGWILLLGALLVLFGRTAPAADAWSVYSAAQNLAGGDTSVIHPTDSYLSYYPQQVGLMAFFELIIRIWNFLPIGLEAYHFIKCLYVVLTCIIVFFQYKTVHLLWENDRTDCIYLILAGASLPMIMYSSFVYGEIPSFTALSVGLYYLLKLLKKMSPDNTKPDNTSTKWYLLQAFISLLGLTLAVMLRKNSLICIIAVVLVVLLESCFSGRKSLLIYCALCITLSLTILPITQKCYELRAGSTLRTGVPAMSYFAMGMQEASRGNGWYNGFNIDTYQNAGMDTELTNELSRQAIQERLDYFKQNPGYAIQFYWHKHLSQWSDGTYASRQATLATFGGRNDFFNNLYDGNLSILYIEFYNIYQIVLYLGALLFCIAQCFRKRIQHLQKQKETAISSDNLTLYIGLISVIGGFLFHILWEANSRYIFIYGLLLIPYAAYGLSLLRLFFTHSTTDDIR